MVLQCHGFFKAMDQTLYAVFSQFKKGGQMTEHSGSESVRVIMFLVHYRDNF